MYVAKSQLKVKVDPSALQRMFSQVDRLKAEAFQGQIMHRRVKQATALI
jgi:hypothetical protein